MGSFVLGLFAGATVVYWLGEHGRRSYLRVRNAVRRRRFARTLEQIQSLPEEGR